MAFTRLSVASVTHRCRLRFRWWLRSAFLNGGLERGVVAFVLVGVGFGEVSDGLVELVRAAEVGRPARCGPLSGRAPGPGSPAQPAYSVMPCGSSARSVWRTSSPSAGGRRSRASIPSRGWRRGSSRGRCRFRPASGAARPTAPLAWLCTGCARHIRPGPDGWASLACRNNGSTPSPASISTT